MLVKQKSLMLHKEILFYLYLLKEDFVFLFCYLLISLYKFSLCVLFVILWFLSAHKIVVCTTLWYQKASGSNLYRIRWNAYKNGWMNRINWQSHHLIRIECFFFLNHTQIMSIILLIRYLDMDGLNWVCSSKKESKTNVSTKAMRTNCGP